MVSWPRASRCPLTQDELTLRRTRHRGPPLRRGPGQRLPAGDGEDRAVGAARTSRRAHRQRRRRRQRGRHPLRPAARQAHRRGSQPRRGDPAPGPAALRRLGVGGVTTNRDFLIAVLEHPAFEAGKLDTHFIERHPAARDAPRTARRGRRAPARDRRRAQRPRAPSRRGIPCRRVFLRAGATTAGARRTSRTGSTPSRQPSRSRCCYVATGPGHLRSGGRRRDVAGRHRPRANDVGARPRGRRCAATPPRRRRRRPQLRSRPPRKRRADRDSHASHRRAPLELQPAAAWPRCPAWCATSRSASATTSSRGRGQRDLLVLEAMKMEHQLVAYAPGCGEGGARGGGADGRSRRRADRAGSRRMTPVESTSTRHEIRGRSQAEVD